MMVDGQLCAATLSILRVLYPNLTRLSASTLMICAALARSSLHVFFFLGSVRVRLPSLVRVPKVTMDYFTA